MSLRFYFGPSDAARSKVLYQEIIDRSMAEPKQTFLVIVPDQFTMQTQKELVTMHERGGIMNIDVLSFGRLGYRVLEEVGYKQVPVLDDTGKSLVLQKVAQGLKDELPVLGGFLHRQGYIHEVKSAISEFMQYGIGREDVDKLIEYAGGTGKRKALEGKLKDLKTLYGGFLDYIHGKYVTAEETLDVLRRSLSKSKLVKDSVIVMEGFTGFTPIQNRLVEELMRLSSEMIMSLTCGPEADPFGEPKEQDLFYLSKKTVAQMVKMATDQEIKRGQDVFVPASANEDGLSHLQKHLFRYTSVPFEAKQNEIRVFEATTVAMEVSLTAEKIKRLLREEGYLYRDIALIVGDLETYAPYIEAEFSRMDIPCYIDRTRGIALNPMIEFMKSALSMFHKNFSYDTVFHYLKSGMADFSPEEVDELENYVIQYGIRGKKTYRDIFVTIDRGRENDSEKARLAEEKLKRLNEIRSRLVDQLSMLYTENKGMAIDYVNGMYEFLVQNHVQEKLEKISKEFEEEGDLTRAREYAQIYRLVMDLLNQIYSLLGEEELSLKEFADILEAGFGEIQVGTIPQNVDRVLVGDIERTRQKSVKVLFFMGVNDTAIPRSASNGGIISDMDREFLRDSELELAPSPRQQMFIQRFYLYLAMIKPEKLLFLSYSRMDTSGKSIRPAYLIDTVKKMYPSIEVDKPELTEPLERIEAPKEGFRYLAEELRDYVIGNKGLDQESFFTLYEALGTPELMPEREMLENAAFYAYKDSNLAKAVAQALYGKNLINSITRLETYAACAYHHFLQYGLSLKEREEYGFEAVDMGNVFHDVLERFSGKLEESEYTWFDFTEEFVDRELSEVMKEASSYGGAVLFSSARNTAAISRMERILRKTIFTMQTQIKQGVFVPKQYEVGFAAVGDENNLTLQLSEDERMTLYGRIDRVDMAEDDERVYVKVVDYKSGDKDFVLANVYWGLQLQLVVYLDAAMSLARQANEGKEVVPAAMFYYHVYDPVIERKKEMSPEEIETELLKQLKVKGIVNSDETVLEKLDTSLNPDSLVIPVKRNKDGSFAKNTSVMDVEHMKIVSSYVNARMHQMGREILDGRISLDPYEADQGNSCQYCAYSKVCGKDPNIPGMKMRVFEKASDDELLKKMEECLGD